MEIRAKYRRRRPKLIPEFYGLKKREVAQLKAAEDDLRLAKEALEKLAPLREKSILAKERQWRLRLAETPLKEATKSPLKRQAVTKDIDDLTEVPKLDRLAAKMREHGWRRSNRKKRVDPECPHPKNIFVNMYRGSGSVDGFASLLGVNRRTTIAWLKKSKIDVFEEIAQDWEKGLSLRKLSVRHGPQPQTISRWIKSTGREIKPRNANPRYDEAEILRLREQENMSPYAISEELRVSWATVQRVIDDSEPLRQRK